MISVTYHKLWGFEGPEILPITPEVASSSLVGPAHKKKELADKANSFFVFG